MIEGVEVVLEDVPVAVLFVGEVEGELDEDVATSLPVGEAEEAAEIHDIMAATLRILKLSGPLMLKLSRGRLEFLSKKEFYFQN